MPEENLPAVEKKLNKEDIDEIKTINEDIFDQSTLDNSKCIQVDEPRRKAFSSTVHIKTDSIHFDFSKTHVSNNEYTALLCKLKGKNIEENVEGMFDGKCINYTENRAVLHTLLRDQSVLDRVEKELISITNKSIKESVSSKTTKNTTKKLKTEEIKCENPECTAPKEECKCADEKCEQKDNSFAGNQQEEKCVNKENAECTDKLKNEKNEVFEELMKIRNFAEDVHLGKIKGSTNKKFKYIINIGIGGSDLGPKVVCKALESFKVDHMRCHFVSNIDPMELYHKLTKVKVEETLFVVVSKTFTTLETMCNAKLALKLVSKMLKKSEQVVSDKHFIAVSSNTEEVKKFGISRIFNMWDFVGGRFSLWSAAGITIALYLGFKNFLRLLTGASVMDKHFKNNPLESACAMHSLVEIYYTLLNYDTKCIVPYDYYLRDFYLHLQQLDMESNGKSAKKNGKLTTHSGMIIWGGVGTNSQHSFFQLLHQGTHKILTEFIYTLVPEREYSTDGSHHTKLLSNCVAQSEALMKGDGNSDMNKLFQGNKPSISIRLSKITPETIGALIAHYEHKVMASGVFFEINSFDQFGVQLGKVIAQKINDTIDGKIDMPDKEKCGCSASSRHAVEEIIKSKMQN